MRKGEKVGNRKFTHFTFMCEKVWGVMLHIFKFLCGIIDVMIYLRKRTARVPQSEFDEMVNS